MSYPDENHRGEDAHNFIIERTIPIRINHNFSSRHLTIENIDAVSVDINGSCYPNETWGTNLSWVNANIAFFRKGVEISIAEIALNGVDYEVGARKLNVNVESAIFRELIDWLAENRFYAIDIAKKQAD